MSYGCRIVAATQHDGDRQLAWPPSYAEIEISRFSACGWDVLRVLNSRSLITTTLIYLNTAFIMY